MSKKESAREDPRLIISKIAKYLMIIILIKRVKIPMIIIIERILWKINLMKIKFLFNKIKGNTKTS